MLYKELFLSKYQKVPVIEYENVTSKNPLVSICVQTYQHSKYISECLDGILMQETNFDFEILLGEDDSSDGTRDICIEYAKKFPDKIKLFLHSRENNIRIYDKPTAKFNVQYNIYSAQGKYLAMCEGDDYWTDPLKLQKQVDFLESNSDYGLIYSDTKLFCDNIDNDEETERFENFKNRYISIKNLYKSGNIFWEILEKNLVNTLTVCLRTNLIQDYFNKFPEEKFAYDHRLWMHIASLSKIKYVDEKSANYRVHIKGLSSSKNFFDKRSPLAKQSALIHYLSIINFNIKLINKNKFSKISYNILKSKNISKKEKQPIRSFLKAHPKFLIYILRWKLKKFFN